MIQYAYTIIYVADVEKTLAFYEKCFQLSRKLLTPEGDYGELASGTTTLAFANYELAESNFGTQFEPVRSDQKAVGIDLAFATADVESTMEVALKNGATLISKVAQKPWGQKVGYVRDINGVLIEICSPMNN